MTRKAFKLPLLIQSMIEDVIKPETTALEIKRTVQEDGDIAVEIFQKDGVFIKIVSVKGVQTAHVSSTPQGKASVNLDELLWALVSALEDLTVSYREIDAGGIRSIEDLHPAKV